MKKNKIKICLLGASFGTNNMGVSALTAGTLKAFFEQYPDGELFVLDYGKQKEIYKFQKGDRIIPVELVNIRFSKKFYLKNNIAMLMTLALISRYIPSMYIRGKIISSNYSLRRVAEADIVVSMAGGDSFSDIYGIIRLLYVSLPQLLALILKKKLVLLPQTIGPFSGGSAKMIAKLIMRRAMLIFSRDREGLIEAQVLTGPRYPERQIRFCYDVGFVLDALAPSNMDLDGLSLQGRKNETLVGFNVSGLLYMGGYNQNNMFGLKIDYRQLVYDVIDYLISKKAATVLLVPHVFGTREHDESDSSVCKLIYSALKQKYKNSLYIAQGTYDQHEIKYIIGRCDFFIGSRMHACIAALSQNVPTVSIAYSKKFIGVMQTIGVEELVADPRKLETGGILKIIDDAFEQRSSLKGNLEKKMLVVKSEIINNLFREIGSHSNSG